MSYLKSRIHDDIRCFCVGTKAKPIFNPFILLIVLRRSPLIVYAIIFLFIDWFRRLFRSTRTERKYVQLEILQYKDIQRQKKCLSWKYLQLNLWSDCKRRNGKKNSGFIITFWTLTACCDWIATTYIWKYDRKGKTLKSKALCAAFHQVVLNFSPVFASWVTTS